MGHGVQRRQRGDGQAAGPAAVRWPAAARSAAGQIEKPTCSASLLLPAWRPAPGRPALMCGTSYRIELCISGVAGSQVGRTAGHVSFVFAALPAARRANHHAGEAGPRALRGMSMTSCSSWLPGRMVIRTSASVCRPTAPTRPPCCQAQLARPGRDHAARPDSRTRAAHPAHPAKPTACPARFPLVMIRTSAIEGPDLRGWGAGVRVPGRYPPACSQICAAAETKHPGPNRRHSASLCQQLMRAPAWACRRVWWRGWRVAAAGRQASREEQHVI